MTFSSIADIQAASTSDLIEFTNAHSGKPPIKKFATRAKAFERACSIWEGMQAAPTFAMDSAPAPAVEWELVGPVAPDIHAQSNEIIGRMLAAEEKAAPAVEEVSVKVAGNAAGVRASWARPEVAAARRTRHAVAVSVAGATTTHTSTHAAFMAFRLPVQACIRFRGQLKKSGREVFEHNGKMYAFALVAIV